MTLPGATVTVVSVATEVPQTASTDAEGQFQFPQLPPGPYRIVVELQGFKRVEKRDIVLSTATRLNVGDFVLDVGAMTETITVAAEAGPAADPDRVGGAIRSRHQHPAARPGA